jgi:hypothetical protein
MSQRLLSLGARVVTSHQGKRFFRLEIFWRHGWRGSRTRGIGPGVGTGGRRLDVGTATCPQPGIAGRVLFAR